MSRVTRLCRTPVVDSIKGSLFSLLAFSFYVTLSRILSVTKACHYKQFHDAFIYTGLILNSISNNITEKAGNEHFYLDIFHILFTSAFSFLEQYRTMRTKTCFSN